MSESSYVCLLRETLTKFIKKGVVDLPAGARAAAVARWSDAINTSNNIQCENNDDDDEEEDPMVVPDAIVVVDDVTLL